MKKLFYITLFSWLVACSLPVQAEPRVVKVGIYHLEPYLGPALKQQGLLAALAVAALEHAGYQAQVESYPLARLMYGLEEGEVDLAPAITATKERQRFAQFSDPLYLLDMGCLFKKGRVNYRRLADLKGLTGGIMRGSFWKRELDQLGVAYEEVAEQMLNIRKLMADRIDFVCLPRGVGFFMLQQAGARPEQYEFGFFMKDGQRAAISRKSRHQSLYADFQSGLRTIRRNGSYDRIVGQWQQETGLTGLSNTPLLLQAIQFAALLQAGDGRLQPPALWGGDMLAGQ